MHQSYDAKNRRNIRLLSVIDCFAGWQYLYGDHSLQLENLEKTFQTFHRQHGHIRSVVSDFPVSNQLDAAISRTILPRVFRSAATITPYSSTQRIVAAFGKQWWISLCIRSFFISSLPLSRLRKVNKMIKTHVVSSCEVFKEIDAVPRKILKTWSWARDVSLSELKLVFSRAL